MLIYISFVVLLVVLICLAKHFDSDIGVLGMMYFFAVFFLGAITLILTIGVIGTQVCGPGEIAKYKVQVLQVEAASNNPKLTDSERVAAIKLAIEINSDIVKTKVYGNNIWTSWFVYRPYGDLPMVDISKIQLVNQNISANISTFDMTEDQSK